jgi:activator of 2-hydroxyglutaryl-CoA dehydratase
MPYPYLEQEVTLFRLSGHQTKFCKKGVLMFYLGIDIGKRTHVASVMNDEGKKFYLKVFLNVNSWTVLTHF